MHWPEIRAKDLIGGYISLSVGTFYITNQSVPKTPFCFAMESSTTFDAHNYNKPGASQLLMHKIPGHSSSLVTWQQEVLKFNEVVSC